MKKFQRGLIIGKFSPLHLGHELLINTALELCEQIVVFSYSQPEFAGCEAHRRRRWLRSRSPSARAFVIEESNLKASLPPGSEFEGIPANDAPDDVQRRFAAELYTQCVGAPLDAVFTSEAYGPGFVKVLNQYFREHTEFPGAVVHVEVDTARAKVPISGTALRAAIHRQRGFLAPEVYADFVTRVCLLGAESTGKTTLCKHLAESAGTCWVDEYGRELHEKKGGELEFEDLLRIAEIHIENEDRALLKANEFLFIDSTPLTTLFYSRALFGRADPRLEKLAERKYDCTFLCMPDIPYVDDSTRSGEQFRQRQHQWYLSELAARQIEYHPLCGPLAEREATVLEISRSCANLRGDAKSFVND